MSDFDKENRYYGYPPPRHDLQLFNDSVGILGAYRNYWLNAFNFRGRTTRPGFWWPLLMNFFVWLALTIVGYEAMYYSFMGLIPFSDLAYSAAKLGPELIITVIASIWYLINSVPFVAISVRRLHDTGKRWPLVLIGIIPISGFVILCVLEIWAYGWLLLCFLFSIAASIILIVFFASMSKFPLHNKLGPLDQV